jgi:hypothetical protein
MNAKPKKKKLCWNCEGNVSVEAENCPYCAVYLSPSGSSDKDLHSPPYGKNQTETSSEIPASPFASQDVAPSEATKNDLSENSGEGFELMKNIIQPLLLLLAGSVFFIFGLALLLFSHNGVFTLRWNGSYWFFYLLLGIPMLFFGWLSLQQLSEEE